MSSQKKIIKKTVQVGISTLVSRVFGIFREVLMVKYLGASGLSDVFLTAYKIPNSLRKIFAEGALSAAFIPTAVAAIKNNNTAAITGLMTLSFLFFEGIVLVLCILVMTYAQHVIAFIAPGFSPEQIEHAIPMIRILMPFIIFISSSALLAGVLQAVGNFSIPALAPIVINIIFIAGISICLLCKLPITALCWFVLSAGVVHFIMHVIAYKRLHFSFSLPTHNDIKTFKHVLTTFFLCLPSASLMEVALFIDTSFASYLPAGSISLLFYANRFVGIPLGVFAVAFSTILLPHFSRVTTYCPSRLHFYLLESTKFIFWVIMPVILLMSFFAQDIFATIFLSKNFTILQVQQAGALLQAFLIGLFFLSLNKIILNIFYAMHAAWIPALIALCATALNIILNILFIERFQALGLAYATTCCAIAQTGIFLLILKKKYAFTLYEYAFLTFALRYIAQLSIFSILFYISYNTIHSLITQHAPANIVFFFTHNIGLWFWVAPLAAFFCLLLWITRSFFKIKLYFLP